VCAALGITELIDPPETTKLVLDLARDVAHGVARPAAPLTAYLLGVAVGRAGVAVGRAADAASRVGDAVTRVGDAGGAGDAGGGAGGSAASSAELAARIRALVETWGDAG